MIHIEVKNGEIGCRMDGEIEDVIYELAYGVAAYHMKLIIEDRYFDHVNEKTACINASVEAFSEILRLMLEKIYDKTVYREHSVEDLQ